MNNCGGFQIRPPNVEAVIWAIMKQAEPIMALSDSLYMFSDNTVHGSEVQVKGGALFASLLTCIT